MITISCSTRCFPQESLDRALVRVAWAGFRGAELALPQETEPDTVPPPDRLADRLEAEDLQLASVDAGSIDLASGDAAVDALAHVGRCALLAQSLGAPTVVITAEGPAGEEPLRSLAEHLGRLLTVLDAVPVSVAVRNALGSVIATPTDFTTLQSRVGSARLALALDPAEALRAGWEADSIVHEITPCHVYLTDATRAGPASLGAGDVDWEGLASALVPRGYSGAVTLLPGGGDPLFAEREAREARAYAEEVFCRER